MAQCDCALITETWFTKNHIDSVVGVSHYSLYRRDRQAGKGGGVCIYVSERINSSVFYPFIDGLVRPCQLEILWLECNAYGHQYFVCCCYHPPRPKYEVNVFVNSLASDIDYINRLYHDAIIIIGGDFNQLNTSFLETDHGLVQMVSTPTHCGHLIDKIFVSCPYVYNCTVYRSILKTKHCGILLTNSDDPLPVSSCKRKVQLFDLRAHNIDRLRYNISLYPWDSLMMCNDVEYLYDLFVNIVHSIILASVPVKIVTIGPRDPDYVTPFIKSLLRQRNRLRRKGRTDDADIIALKINSLITQNRATRLEKLSTATSKQLWDAVNKSRHHNADNGSLLLMRDPDAINDFFANIAAKENYDRNELLKFRCDNPDARYQPLTNFEVEFYLRRTKLTAPGCDGIPAWLLRTCSYELAEIVTCILNCSFSTGCVPSPWLNALVTPVPKVPKPTGMSDFRPISVTPHLSRIAEKILVRRWLFPFIPTANIIDQYAFKPSGSTTAALIHFTDKLTKMLETNYYVRCLLIDFSKAFDTVDHVLLLNKLVQLDLPTHVINWICSFLSGRSQQCKVNGQLSNMANIGLSIVQGSGIGPTLYIIMKSDLHAVSCINVIIKFADDTTLLVPENTDVGLDVEFRHVRQWAESNRLTLNTAKTKEIVFRRPRVKYFHMPPAVDSIEQMDCCKLLGVFFQSNLKMDSHVQYILSQCAQRMYILKLLRSQGMPIAQLSTVAYSLIIGRILYALPAWGGFISVELTQKINALFKRIKSYGYISRIITIDDLIAESTLDLFKKMCIPTHCLYHLLPDYRVCDNLRLRGHRFQLPTHCTVLHRNSFVTRSLYLYV